MRRQSFLVSLNILHTHAHTHTIQFQLLSYNKMNAHYSLPVFYSHLLIFQNIPAINCAVPILNKTDNILWKKKQTKTSYDPFTNIIETYRHLSCHMDKTICIKLTFLLFYHFKLYLLPLLLCLPHVQTSVLLRNPCLIMFTTPHTFIF